MHFPEFGVDQRKLLLTACWHITTSGKDWGMHTFIFIMQILIANFQTLLAFKSGNFAYMLDNLFCCKKTLTLSSSQVQSASRWAYSQITRTLMIKLAFEGNKNAPTLPFSAFTIVISNKKMDNATGEKKNKEHKMQSVSVPGCSQPGSTEISGHAGGTHTFATHAKWPDTATTDAAGGQQHRTHFSCQTAKEKTKINCSLAHILLSS